MDYHPQIELPSINIYPPLKYNISIEGYWIDNLLPTLRMYGSFNKRLITSGARLQILLIPNMNIVPSCNDYCTVLLMLLVLL